MCAHCGCGIGTTVTLLDLQTGKEISLEDPHDHTDHYHHDHHHGHGHHHEHPGADGANPGDAQSHGPGHRLHRHGLLNDSGGATIELEARILAKNDALAARNRAWFAGREILSLNLISSPGAGKTTLLERTIRDLKGELPLFVIEGDQATAIDGERISAAGAPVVQVNTGVGCHLEADMVARGLTALRPSAGSVVLIENVGNLVCPAMFDLGERAKVAILSVTDGEDKPLKYPHIFRAADLVLLNKIDLLPHVDFDVPRAVANALLVNPDVTVLCVSARTGEGFNAWYGWLRGEMAAAHEAAFI
jgi:hydrogenase nickel incorporation protein HypB